MVDDLEHIEPHPSPLGAILANRFPTDGDRVQSGDSYYALEVVTSMAFPKCLHCFKEIPNSWVVGYSERDGNERTITFAVLTCPLCQRTAAKLVLVPTEGSREEMVVFPLGNARPVPPQVPKKYASEFIEASRTLSVSPKASAALSRRCLQLLLEDIGKVTKRQLSDQIQEAIASGSLPAMLRERLSVLRELGNFGAHPIKGEHPGEIVDVELNEAEWCLDTIADLFDYWFVRPVEEKRLLDEFNAKLKAIGRRDYRLAVVPIVGQSPPSRCH